jgi:hypothetical protein
MWLNLLMLMTVVAIPFATDLLGTYVIGHGSGPGEGVFPVPAAAG